jgi:hypothetical protein
LGKACLDGAVINCYSPSLPWWAQALFILFNRSDRASERLNPTISGLPGDCNALLRFKSLSAPVGGALGANVELTHVFPPGPGAHVKAARGA